MTATPFKGLLTLKNVDGTPETCPFTGSDVAGDYVQFTNSGLSFVSPKNNCYMVDITLLAAGVDTDRLSLFVNGKEAGCVYLDAALLTTVQTAHIILPPGIAAGASVQLKQM